MANIATQLRYALPLPTDLEVFFGWQGAFEVAVEEVDDATGVATAADITGWTVDIDIEAYDGTSADGLVSNLVARSDTPAKGSQTRVELTNPAGGILQVDFKAGLCPANPVLGENIIILVYVKVTDAVTPNPNTETRMIVLSYEHNADFA